MPTGFDQIIILATTGAVLLSALLLARYVRERRRPSPPVIAAGLLVLGFLATLVGVPVSALLAGLLTLALVGGGMALALVAAWPLRCIARGRPAARAALILGVALAAWLPAALLQAEVSLGGIMHRDGARIDVALGEPTLTDTLGWSRRDAVKSELRWRSLLPLHPSCVTRVEAVCARLDALGYDGAEWRGGLGPALLAGLFVWGVTLPPAADRRGSLVGALHVAYGSIAAGAAVILATSSLTLRPLVSLFAVPWPREWPPATLWQLVLATMMIVAGVGIRRGREWASALALVYAATTTVLAVGVLLFSSLFEPLPALMQPQGQWQTGLEPLVARLLVAALIVAANLRLKWRSAQDPLAIG